MEFNDGSQYRVVTDPATYMRSRPMFEFRATSASSGRFYVDTAYARHRRDLQGCQALLMYQFPYASAGSAEDNANFFCDTIGALNDHEMVMLDIEGASGIGNPADFTRRWLAVVEKRLTTRAWVYLPKALASSAMYDAIGDRVIKAPRYSGSSSRGAAPNWGRYDVHQYTDQGWFPGCSQSGDTNYTSLSVADLLDRCRVGGAATSTAKRQQKMILT